MSDPLLPPEPATPPPTELPPPRRAVRSQRSSTADRPAQLLREVLKHLGCLESLKAELEVQLPVKEQPPHYAAAQALLGHDDAALVYRVTLVTADGKAFELNGHSTFPDFTSQGMLGEAAGTFQQNLHANLVRPLTAKNAAFLQPFIQHASPEPRRQLTDGYGGDEAYTPGSGASGDSGLLSED